MKIRSPLIPVLVLGLLAPAATAASGSIEEMEVRLLDLQNQMTEMHRQMETLRAEMAAMRETEPAGTPPPEPPVAQAPASVVASQHSATSKYPLRFYGKIKFDAIYDSNDLGTDEFITFLLPGADGDSQSTFTARETRIGLGLGGPGFGDWTTSARIETDFYGSAPSSGSGSLRIRLAYVDLTHGETLIRVGQDWLPIATANPATTNFTIMGYNGNLWGRIPQVTASRRFNSSLTGYVSTFRCRDEEDAEHGLSCDLIVPWMAAGLRFQGRLLDDEKPATFALGGAIRPGEVEGRSVTPQLLAAEFSVPWKKLTLKGELYSGEGLGGEFLHRGGAFNLAGEPIRTRGGFLQLGLQVAPPVQLNVGYGFDDPRDGDLVADEFFRKSTTLFGNAVYDFTTDLSVILEGTRVETTWSDGPRDGYRFQSSFVFVW